ncbi:MAG: MarR family winged helix-turn-helix transcriptional regulator [Calditrichia bacterium]
MTDLKRSIFDLQTQQTDTAAKAVVALERIAESFRVALWEKAKTNSLSPLQVQLLIFLQFHPEKQRNVSYLSHEFNMSKPTISDAIKALHNKGHIEKEVNSDDRRAYHINLTSSGKQLSEELADFANPLRTKIASWPDASQAEFLESLMQVMRSLQTLNLISPQRMCLNCRFFEQSADGYYCNFLKSPLAREELRVDCPEFEESER